MKRILIGAVLPVILISANQNFPFVAAQQQIVSATDAIVCEYSAPESDYSTAETVSLRGLSLVRELEDGVTDGSSSEALIVDDTLPVYGPTEEDYEYYLEWLKMTGIRYYDIPLTAQQQYFVTELCARYDVPVTLVYGVMFVESNFTSDARSSNGKSYGIMQISRINHASLKKLLGVSDFLNFEDNVTAGVYLLSTYLNDLSGSYHLSLISYNCGIIRASELFAKGVRKTDYSCNVIRYSKHLKETSYDELVACETADAETVEPA